MKYIKLLLNQIWYQLVTPNPRSVHPNPRSVHPNPRSVHPNPRSVHPNPRSVHPIPQICTTKVVVKGYTTQKDQLTVLTSSLWISAPIVVIFVLLFSRF